jgi:DNA invertase Pin-like site-specific DNA recombinase
MSYDDRRRRQAQGQARAKAAGLYKGRQGNKSGRQGNKSRNDGIAAMLRAGSPWSQIQNATGCSRSTVARIAKRM